MECRECGVNRQSDEFYAGRLVCKPCVRERSRENRKARIDYYREKDRKRSKTPERREHIKATTESWKARHPEKRKAQVAVGNAVRDGRLHRPNCCSYCGEPGKVEAHHYDYSRPLDVVWLCSPCHAGIHNRPIDASPAHSTGA